jgi:hypothetical protein
MGLCIDGKVMGSPADAYSSILKLHSSHGEKVNRSDGTPNVIHNANILL